MLGGEVEEVDAELIEGRCGDVFSVGRPARGEHAFGARKRGDAASGEVEDANRAFRVASSERAGRVDDPLSVRGPVGVGLRASVAGKQPPNSATFGRDDVGLVFIFFLREADEEEALAVGRPTGQDRLQRRVDELDPVAPVAVGAPEASVGVGDVDDVGSIFGEGEKIGGDA